MLQHTRPRVVETGWIFFLEGVGDAQEGLDPSCLTEIGAPGSPCWPLPCHQGGQLPNLAAAHFGGRRGCRSSPPLPLHRSVRSQKWSAGAINESWDTIPNAGGLDRCGCAFRCTFNLFRWLSRGGGGGGGCFIVKFAICMGWWHVGCIPHCGTFHQDCIQSNFGEELRELDLWIQLISEIRLSSPKF